MGLREKGQRRNQMVPGLAQTQAMRHHRGWGRDNSERVAAGGWGVEAARAQGTAGNRGDDSWRRGVISELLTMPQRALWGLLIWGDQLSQREFCFPWYEPSLPRRGIITYNRVPFSAYRSYWDPAARPLGSGSSPGAQREAGAMGWSERWSPWTGIWAFGYSDFFLKFYYEKSQTYNTVESTFQWILAWSTWILSWSFYYSTSIHPSIHPSVHPYSILV